MRSLYKDLLEAGGGALPSPHVGAGHLIDQNETRQFKINIIFRKIKRKDWVITFEHIPQRSAPDQLQAISSPPKMCAGAQSIP